MTTTTDERLRERRDIDHAKKFVLNCMETFTWPLSKDDLLNIYEEELENKRMHRTKRRQMAAAFAFPLRHAFWELVNDGVCTMDAKRNIQRKYE